MVIKSKNVVFLCQESDELQINENEMVDFKSDLKEIIPISGYYVKRI